jgi:hypothetical protein
MNLIMGRLWGCLYGFVHVILLIPPIPFVVVPLLIIRLSYDSTKGEKLGTTVFKDFLSKGS